jgi:cell division protein FtsN
MRRWILMFGVLVLCVTSLGAQTPARPIDPVFVRAQALVSDGNGAAGRALIDSMLAATPASAPLYPQALFWRASLAASAADAESDYRHIVVDYPLAPQAEDALLRLAQLELARGDRDGALIHLQRIQRDYPHSKSLARASYWTARVLFEKNDIPSACAANAAALSQSDPTEVELRNQIQYQGQRCPTVAVSSEPAASVATARTESTSVAAPAITAPAVNLGSTSRASGSASPAVSAAAATVSTASSTAASTSGMDKSAHRLSPPSEANDAKPSIVDPAKAPRSASEKPASSNVALSKGNNPTAGATYSVQVAAYNHKVDAEQLAATLTKRGYAARVDGTVAPFRVRIGRYATNNEAEDALKKIKSKHMDGFVARVSER